MDEIRWPNVERPDGSVIAQPRSRLSGADLLTIIVTALVGIGIGLLWVVLMTLVDSWVEMTGTMLAWTVGSIAAGGVVGLCVGLVGRPLLLLVWIPAAAVGALVAAQLDVETAGEEAAVYLVMTYSLLIAAPSVVGCVFGLAIRRSRVDRSPRALVVTVAVAAGIVAIILIPGVDPSWRIAVLIGALWLGWRQWHRGAHPPPGRSEAPDRRT